MKENNTNNKKIINQIKVKEKSNPKKKAKFSLQNLMKYSKFRCKKKFIN